MAQISIRVDDSKKEEWMKEAENNEEYESLTHLIELAVHHELNDEWIQLSNVNLVAEEIEFDTSEVEISLDDIKDDLAGLYDQIRKLEAFGEALERDEVRELAVDIQDFLPVVEGMDELSIDRDPDDSYAEAARKTGHPADIYMAVDDARADGVSRADVRLALDYLVRSANSIKDANDPNGDRVYYQQDKTISE